MPFLCELVSDMEWRHKLHRLHRELRVVCFKELSEKNLASFELQSKSVHKKQVCAALSFFLFQYDKR